jgi:hypothetical protein
MEILHPEVKIMQFEKSSKLILEMLRDLANLDSVSQEDKDFRILLEIFIEEYFQPEESTQHQKTYTLLFNKSKKLFDPDSKLGQVLLTFLEDSSKNKLVTNLTSKSRLRTKDIRKKKY